MTCGSDTTTWPKKSKKFIETSSISKQVATDVRNGLTFDMKIRTRACGGAMSVFGKAGGPFCMLEGVPEGLYFSPDHGSLLIREQLLYGSHQAYPMGWTVLGMP